MDTNKSDVFKFEMEIDENEERTVFIKTCIFEIPMDVLTYICTT